MEEEDEEEEELDVTIEGAEEDEEEEEMSELWDAWDGDIQMSDERRKKAADRPELLQLLCSSSSQVGGAPGPGSAGTTAVCRNKKCLIFVFQVAARQQRTADLQQKSEELRERLMVSEATVQAQAEQLKDYRDLLSEWTHLQEDRKTYQSSEKVIMFPSSSAETAVQQDSKQIQVDLQDLGYETCGRSENEAEREDTSSPGPPHCFPETAAPAEL